MAENLQLAKQNIEFLKTGIRPGASESGGKKQEPEEALRATEKATVS